MKDELEKKIDADEYTLYDQIIYGGLGYGKYCLPTNLLRVIFTVIFPPIGVIMKYMDNDFPYINLNKLLNGLGDIMYCFLLTMLFYIPGLIYALSSLNHDAAEQELRMRDNDEDDDDDDDN